MLYIISDTDWASNKDDRTSINTYIIFLGHNLISKSYKKYYKIFYEVEYRSVTSTTIEIYCIQLLLNELFITISDPPSIYCENIGITYLCANFVFHFRMKRIAIDFHFVRDKVQNGELCVSHILSFGQLVDTFTKPLSH